MEIQELLLKVSEILEKLKVKYCITGGYAVSVWGRPRATFDIDVVIQLKEENINLLAENLRLLSRAGYIEEEAAKRAVSRGGEFNFIHPESGLKVDFWVIRNEDKIGLQELERSIAKDLNGRKINFISPEDLILSKLRWYRESESTRHLEDIESVLKISGEKIDMEYLKKWAVKQNMEDALNKILKK